MATPKHPDPNAGRYQADVYQHKSLREWVLEIAIFLIVAGTLVATGLAARFTYGQWDVSFDTEKRSLRAYVLLNDLQIIPTTANNALLGYIVIPKWQNIGSTAASRMTFLVNYQFSHDDLPSGFTNVDGDRPVEGPTDVAPKETLNVGGIRDKDGQPLYYHKSCLLDLQDQKFRFSYIWGWAKYHDIFEPNELRVTRFCRRLYGTYVLRNEVVFNQYLCNEGNCQDKECDKYEHIPQPRMPTDLCRPITVPIGAQAAKPVENVIPWPPTSQSTKR